MIFILGLIIGMIGYLLYVEYKKNKVYKEIEKWDRLHSQGWCKPTNGECLHEK